MKYKEQKRRQAFIDEVKAVELKHGYRLNYYQPPIQVVIQPIQIPKVTKEARKAVEELVKTGEMPTPKPAWWKRLLNQHEEDRKTTQV